MVLWCSVLCFAQCDIQLGVLESNIFRALLREGHSVRALVRRSTDVSSLSHLMVIETQAVVHQCNSTIHMTTGGYTLYPAVVNDHNLHHHVQRVGKLLLGSENVKLGQKILASDDFSFYQQFIPGVILNIGIRNEVLGSVHHLHSPHFFLDEEVLPIGATVLTALAKVYLNDQWESEKPQEKTTTETG